LKIRIVGTGGQGVVLASVILAKAAVYEGKYAVQTQLFGAAARGGTTKADVVIDKEPILDVFFEDPDVILALHWEAWRAYECKGCMVIADSSLGIPRAVERPFFEVARELGSPLYGNIVALGFLAKLGIVSIESLSKSVWDLTPEKLRERNLRALERGYEL